MVTSVSIAAFARLTIALVIGYGIRRIVSIKPATTPVHHGRNWFGWLVLIMPIAMLCGSDVTTAIAGWLFGTAFYGGIAFGCGYMYGAHAFQGHADAKSKAKPPTETNDSEVVPPGEQGAFLREEDLTSASSELKNVEPNKVAVSYDSPSNNGHGILNEHRNSTRTNSSFPTYVIFSLVIGGIACLAGLDETLNFVRSCAIFVMQSARVIAFIIAFCWLVTWLDGKSPLTVTAVVVVGAILIILLRGRNDPPDHTNRPSYSYSDFPPATAENGDIRGADNDGDGRSEPIHVQGYYRKDGTYVRGHYRARPR